MGWGSVVKWAGRAIAPWQGIQGKQGGSHAPGDPNDPDMKDNSEPDLWDQFGRFLPNAWGSVSKIKSASDVPAPSTGGAPAPSTGGAPGELTYPGYGEKFFDETGDWYKKWASSLSQPTASQQLWAGQSGRFNDPTTEQSKLWGAYSKDFSNPAALDDFYARQANRTQTALNRKSSSAGWADSGAAARATQNIGSDFADRALLARQGWASTGMGLAGAVDASLNDKDRTGMTMAGAADASFYDSLKSASSVLGTGQGAASTAQSLKEGRLTGGLTSATRLAQDQANLALMGFTSQQQDDFNWAMVDFQLRMKRDGLSAEQAYAEAQEFLKGMGVAKSAAIDAYIKSKLGMK